MTIGGKYKFVPDSNPGVGHYSPDVMATKRRSRVARIKRETQVIPYMPNTAR